MRKRAESRIRDGEGSVTPRTGVSREASVLPATEIDKRCACPTFRRVVIRQTSVIGGSKIFLKKCLPVR